MVFLLIRDVPLDHRPRGGAHRERRVAYLPGKGEQADLLMYPRRRCFFQLTHEIRQAMSSFQANEQMDMIRDAADALRKSAEAGNGPAQVFVQPRTPFGGDDGFAVFGSEHQMIMQAQVGRSHATLQSITMLRPLPGSPIGHAREPVVSLRSTTG